MDSDQPRVRDTVNDEPCQVLTRPHAIAVVGAGQAGSTFAYPLLTSGLGAANEGMKREEEQCRLGTYTATHQARNQP